MYLFGSLMVSESSGRRENVQALAAFRASGLRSTGCDAGTLREFLCTYRRQELVCDVLTGSLCLPATHRHFAVVFIYYMYSTPH